MLQAWNYMPHLLSLLKKYEYNNNGIDDVMIAVLKTHYLV